MQNKTKLGAVLLTAAVAVGGCSDASSVTGPQHHPAGPAFNGIGWFGSGNRTGSDSTTTITETSTTPLSSSDGSSAAGIGTAGSGN